MTSVLMRILVCDGCGGEERYPEGTRPKMQEFDISARNLETGQRRPTTEVLHFHHACVPDFLKIIMVKETNDE